MFVKAGYFGSPRLRGRPITWLIRPWSYILKFGQALHSAEDGYIHSYVFNPGVYSTCSYMYPDTRLAKEQTLIWWYFCFMEAAFPLLTTPGATDSLLDLALALTESREAPDKTAAVESSRLVHGDIESARFWRSEIYTRASLSKWTGFWVGAALMVDTLAPVIITLVIIKSRKSQPPSSKQQNSEARGSETWSKRG